MSSLATVTSIGPRRYGDTRRLLYLDGEPWRELPADVLRSLALTEGEVVDPDALLVTVAEVEPEACRQRALRLLEHKDRSSEELRRRLDTDGYAPAVVRSVIERYVAVGLLDDDALIRRHAREMIERKHFGPDRLRVALRKRGFSNEQIDETLGVLLDEGALRHNALLAARLHASRARDVPHLVKKLRSLGYDWDVARSCASLAWEDVPEPPA